MRIGSYGLIIIFNPNKEFVNVVVVFWSYPTHHTIPDTYHYDKSKADYQVDLNFGLTLLRFEDAN